MPLSFTAQNLVKSLPQPSLFFRLYFLFKAVTIQVATVRYIPHIVQQDVSCTISTLVMYQLSHILLKIRITTKNCNISRILYVRTAKVKLRKAGLCSLSTIWVFLKIEQVKSTGILSSTSKL